MFLNVFAVIAFIVASIVSGYLTKSLMERKGYFDSQYFWMGLFLGFVALIYAAGHPVSEQMRAQEMSKILELLQAEKLSDATNQPFREASGPVQPMAAKTTGVERASVSNRVKENAPKDNKPVAPDVARDDQIKCPNCNFVQRSSRNVCFHCGTKFIKPGETDG